MHQCKESINTIFIAKTSRGFIVRPCCWFKEDRVYHVPHIRDITKHPYMKEIQENFISDWKQPTCQACITAEESGVESKRQKSLEYPDVPRSFSRWDIRFSNICNLKCIMCGPMCSSKWSEDIDTFNEFQEYTKMPFPSGDKSANLTDADWGYILLNARNSAYEMYFAGGEPFYDKGVMSFLDKLSEYEFNRENTIIVMQTNGISNNPKVIEVLSRFKLLTCNISVDGWGSVNELIRFPTKQDILEKNIAELRKISTWIHFNLTVQALNLPHLEEAFEKLNPLGDSIQTHLLSSPKYLSINALKPQVIDRVLGNSKNNHVINMCKNYQYNDSANEKMQKYLLALDKVRGTDSKKVASWCFE